MKVTGRRNEWQHFHHSAKIVPSPCVVVFTGIRIRFVVAFLNPIENRQRLIYVPCDNLFPVNDDCRPVPDEGPFNKLEGILFTNAIVKMQHAEHFPVLKKRVSCGEDQLPEHGIDDEND